VSWGYPAARESGRRGEGVRLAYRPPGVSRAGFGVRLRVFLVKTSCAAREAGGGMRGKPPPDGSRAGGFAGVGVERALGFKNGFAVYVFENRFYKREKRFAAGGAVRVKGRARYGRGADMRRGCSAGGRPGRTAGRPGKPPVA
jgi:hypothetical protein